MGSFGASQLRSTSLLDFAEICCCGYSQIASFCVGQIREGMRERSSTSLRINWNDHLGWATLGTRTEEKLEMNSCPGIILTIKTDMFTFFVLITFLHSFVVNIVFSLW